MAKDYLTTTQASRCLGCSPMVVVRAFDAGQIPGHKARTARRIPLHPFIKHCLDGGIDRDTLLDRLFDMGFDVMPGILNAVKPLADKYDGLPLGRRKQTYMRVSMDIIEDIYNAYWKAKSDESVRESEPLRGP